MKKRLLACLGILLAIVLLAVWGGYTVRHFQQKSEESLDYLMQGLENGTATTQQADACIEAFRKQEHLLAIFLRRDYLAALDMNFCAMKQYLLADEKKRPLRKSQGPKARFMPSGTYFCVCFESCVRESSISFSSSIKVFKSLNWR